MANSRDKQRAERSLVIDLPSLVGEATRTTRARNDSTTERAAWESKERARAVRMARVRAFEMGWTDGQEWRRENPETAAPVTGWGEAAINAMGARWLSEKLGIPAYENDTITDDFRSALREYDRGAVRGAGQIR